MQPLPVFLARLMLGLLLSLAFPFEKLCLMFALFFKEHIHIYILKEAPLARVAYSSQENSLFLKSFACVDAVSGTV